MGLEKDVRRSVRARYDDEDDYELVPSEEEEGEEAEEGEDEKQTDELKGSSSDTEEDMTSDGDVSSTLLLQVPYNERKAYNDARSRLVFQRTMDHPYRSTTSALAP